MDNSGKPSANKAIKNGADNAASAPASMTALQRRPGKPPGHAKPPGSGRKPGTPNKSTKEIRAIAQKHGSKAVRELVNLMTKSDNEVTRLKAAVELLDRGYGRPTSTTELTGADGGPIETKDVTPMERARRIGNALRKAAEETPD